MKMPEWLRLGLISLSVLVLQQALLLARPEWRSGLDFYVVWLLIVSASRGGGTGVVLALLGGFIMDAPSVSFGLFHTVFYLLPVAVGALFTAHLITEYNLLAAAITAGLLLLKFILMLAVALAMGWIDTPAYFFGVNYLPLLVLSVLVFAFWQRLVRLAPVERVVLGGRLHGR